MEGRDKKGRFKKGFTPWNKDLTKEIDTRVAKYAKKLSISMLGNIPWNKGIHQWENNPHPKGMLGKHHTQEAKDKIGRKEKGRNNPRWNSRPKFCIICGREFFVSPCKEDKKCCSRECYEIWRGIRQMGQYNPNWKGGISFDYGRNWKIHRQLCLERDKYVCRICGNKEGLCVHHIIPLSDFNGDWEHANNINNLITVCRSHHTKVDRNLNEETIKQLHYMVMFDYDYRYYSELWENKDYD